MKTSLFLLFSAAAALSLSQANLYNSELPSFTLNLDMMFPSNHTSSIATSTKDEVRSNVDRILRQYADLEKPSGSTPFLVLRGILVDSFEQHPSVVLALSFMDAPACNASNQSESGADCFWQKTPEITGFLITPELAGSNGSEYSVMSRSGLHEIPEKSSLKKALFQANKHLFSIGVLTIQELNRVIFSRSLDLKKALNGGAMEADLGSAMSSKGKDYVRFWRRVLSPKDSKIFLFPLGSTLSAMARERDATRQKRGEMDYNEIVYAFSRMDNPGTGKARKFASDEIQPLRRIPHHRANQIIHNPQNAFGKRDDDCVPVTWYNVFHHCIFGKPKFCHV